MASAGTFWNNNKVTQRTTYNCKGRKNKTNYKGFLKVCRLPQMELKTHLTNFLVSKGYDIEKGNGYVYGRGDIPVLVTAHMDTVHKENVKDFYEYVEKKGKEKRHIISSPQGIGGDDRCGIYMIKQIIKEGLKPYVLFCEDEEIGGVGSSKFCRTELIDELKDMYFLIELDRAHANDVVFYSDANEDFHDFVIETTGYKKDTGSFSDISNLSPACGVSSVNISCGYYNAHSTDEYVVMEEMENSIKTTIELIKAGVKREEKFEYKKVVYNFGYRNSWYDDDYSYYGGYFGSRYDYRSESKATTKEEPKEEISSIEKENEVYVFIDFDGTEFVAEGASLEEAFGTVAIHEVGLCWGDIMDFETYSADEYKVYSQFTSKETEEETEEQTDDDEELLTLLAGDGFDDAEVV